MPERTVFVLAFPGLGENLLVKAEVANMFGTGYLLYVGHRGRPAGIYLFIYLSSYLSTMQDCGPIRIHIDAY